MAFEIISLIFFQTNNEF